VGNSTPVFAAKNPDVFFGLLEALSPNSEGKVDMAKVGKYIAEHPSTQAAAHWQSTTMAPYSYASSEFYGLHTFYFENDDKELTKFRWHTKPDRGVRTLTKEEMAELPSKFLNDRLVSESQDGKISYTISVAIGKDEDTTNDPSQKWPDDREIMEFGKLILNSVGGDLCTPINFDPNVMSAGFKSSDDPVLRMRSPAYALSFGKRLSGQ
jgi:catalase